MTTKNTMSEQEAHDHVNNTSAQPQQLHAAALAHPDTHEEIAKHPNIGTKTLEHIYNHNKDKVKANPEKYHEYSSEHGAYRAAAAHPNAPKHIVEERFNEITPDNYNHNHDHGVLKHNEISKDKRQAKAKEILDTDSYESKSLAREHFNHPDTDEAETKSYLKHKNPEVAGHAAASGKVSKEDVKAHFARKDVGAKDTHEVIENGTPDQEYLSQAYSKFKGQKDDEEHSYGKKQPSDIIDQIAGHSNIPEDARKDLIGKKVVKEREGWRASNRERALNNPATPSEELGALVQRGDKEAMHAAINRHDTNEDTIRAIDSHMENKKDLLAHPNYPKDITLKAIKESTDNARAVLNRPNLDEDTMKELLNHKNQKVAVDALRHKSITPELVQHATGRKAGDVSRAAAAHPLASQDMKIGKALKDPVAAQELARRSDDPKVLAEIHKAHANDPEIIKALSNNKNLSPDTINSILKNPMESQDRYGNKVSPSDGLSSHPNLNEEGRAHFLQNAPASVASHPNLSSEEISRGLKRANELGEDHRNDFVNEAMKHKNLSEADAKDIVTGKYGTGPRRADYGHINEFEDEDGNKGPHPAYTPDVVRAGLNTNSELSNPELVHQLAQSKHLQPDELKSIVNSYNPNQGTMEEREHPASKVSGALKNPNLSADVQGQVLNDPDTDPNHINALLQNPNLDKQHLKNFYSSNNEHLKPALDSGKHIPHLKSAINDQGLTEDALKNTPHQALANSLVDAGYGQINEDNLKTVLEHNKNPNVLKGSLEQLTNSGRASSFSTARGNRKAKTNTQVGISPELQPVIDKLADHPDDEVAGKAFQHLSPSKQDEVFKRLGNTNPDIVPHLKEDTIKNFKIGNDTSDETASAVLEHQHATPEHFSQAIKKSPDMAYSAIHSLGNKENLDNETKNKLHNQALDAHPNDDRVAYEVAKQATDPKTFKRLLSKPEDDRVISTIAKNPNVKTADLDHLSNFHGPEYSKAFGEIADNPKASVGLLGHISEHYPEHMAEVAKNPKAASAKVLKNIISKGDTNAKVNLVNNEKVPQGVKDELLKDKAVLFGAHPKNVSAEQLQEHATDKDLNVVNAVVNHPRVSSEDIDRAVDHAVKSISSDPKGANAVIASASKKNNLSKKAQEKVIMHSPEAAANVVDELGEKRINQDAVLGALQRFHGKNAYDSLERNVMARGAYGNPQIAEHLVNTVDFNGVDKDGSNTERLAQMFEKSSDLKPENYQAALSKIKEVRPTDFKYPDNDQGKVMRDGDSKLMTNLLQGADDSQLSEYSGLPAFSTSLVQNPKIGKANLSRAIDNMVNPANNIKPDSAAVKAIINQAHATPEDLDKVYDHVMKTGSNGQKARIGDEWFAKSRKISPDLATKVYATAKDQQEILKNPRLPKETLKKHIETENTHIEDAAKNPNFDLSVVKDIDPEEFSKKKVQIYKGLASNNRAKPEDLEQVYKHSSENGKYAHKDLVTNAKTPEHIAKSMLENKEVRKEDLYKNPAIGGKLWREEKHSFPEDVPGLEAGKEINQAKFTPQADKVKAVADQIPENGYIDWAEFKKANPGQAGNPVVQRLFATADKQRLTKDHADKYLASMPSKNFHVSYQKWSGMQRHDDKKNQAVFVINNGESMDHAYRQDPNLLGLYRTVQLANQNEGHPHGPQAIGWSRVDTNHPDNWHIDEVQSDFNASLSRELHEINESGKSSGMEDAGVDPSESHKAVNGMLGLTQGWEKAAVQNIIDTAKAHGVKQISMNSAEGKTRVNKGHDAEVTNKYDKIYNRLPEEMGFKRAKYESLPNHNPKSDLVGHDVWVLDLNPSQDNTAAPKQDKKTA